MASDDPTDTPWQRQRAAAFDEISKKHGGEAAALFVKAKAKELRLAGADRKTKRKVLDTLRSRYEKLRAEYLRIEGTTYQGWLDYGAAKEWDEVLAAMRDDAIWDRLVETYEQRETR